MTDFNKFRRDLASTIKSEIEKHEVALRVVRTKELSKNDRVAAVDLGCVICGEQNACVCLDPMGVESFLGKVESKVCDACSQLNCSCSGKLPDDKKSKDLGGEEGSGGKIDTKKLFKKAFKKAAKKLAKKKLEETAAMEKCGDTMPVKKADAPAAKPPGKSPEASHPTAKVGSPVIKNDGGLPSTGSTTITGASPSSIPKDTGSTTITGVKPSSVAPQSSLPSTGSTTITGASPSSIPKDTGSTTITGASPSSFAAPGRTSTGQRQATPSAPTSGRTSQGKRMAMSEASIIPENLRKAGMGQPRLGGRDPASQMMTQHAAMSAPPPGPAAAAAPKTKLTPEDHARRAAGLAEFTPAGAFTPTSPTGSTSGAMQAGAPPALGAPPGIAPSPTAPAPAPAKPMGTSATGGFFDRFKKG